MESLQPLVRRARPILAGLGALAVAACLAAPASARYQVAATWGSLGKGPGEFGSGILGGGAMRQYDDPAGIAVARNGTILVVDTSNNRVQRFTPEGRYLGRFGRRGLDKGFVELRLTDRFFQPEGIAVDRAGSIYVADSGNDRVMKFNSRGRFRKRLGKHGSFPGEYVQPWGVAVHAGTVFVIDQGNYRVHRRAAGGAYRGAFGSFGRGPGRFVTPYGIAAAAGRVWVTDHIRHVLMAFTPRGRLVGEFGSAGDGRGEFLKPAGIAVGPDGSLFVADRCNRRVQRFTADGAYVESFGRGLLRAPTFLAVDRAGNVYVADHHRVVKFAPAAGSSRVAAGPASHDGVDIQCRHVQEMALGSDE